VVSVVQLIVVIVMANLIYRVEEIVPALIIVTNLLIKPITVIAPAPVLVSFAPAPAGNILT
jgi:hypothetical protein